MDTIINIISVVTMLISAFMLMDISYSKLKGKQIDSQNVFNYTLLFLTGTIFFIFPVQQGLLYLLFMMLFISLIKMILLTNKLSKQTN